MTWFWITLSAPIIYALVNQTDKYFISRHLKNDGVGAIVIISSVFNILALPIIYWLANSYVLLPWIQALALAVNGIFTILAILFYLYALQEEEASVVTPFFQTVPLLAFVLGYFILGETLTAVELFGCLLIVAGTMILSFEIKRRGRLKFKRRLVLFMFASALMLAINAVIFKLIAVEAGFLVSIFWDFVGKTTFGLLLFIIVGSYRREFIDLIKIKRGKIFGLIFITQLITIVGDFIASYAVLLAPVAIVSAVLGLQPLFVFIYGLILTLFFPWFVKESLNKRELIQKIAAIILVIIGGWLIGS
jgi:drug/metabolite transporter (DMT)-like permease